MRIIILSLLIFTNALADKGLPNIVGSWKSDAKRTYEHLLKHANLTDYQKRVFATFFGNATIEYRDNGTGTIHMGAYKMPKEDGTELDLRETEIHFTYEVIGRSESQIVIKSTSKDDLFPDHPFAILKFHDPDTFSVSLSEGIADLNGREFFKRIKKK